jgi:hypothetical protein
LNRKGDNLKTKIRRSGERGRRKKGNGEERVPCSEIILVLPANQLPYFLDLILEK